VKTLQASFRSGSSIEDCQLDPVVRAQSEVTDRRGFQVRQAVELLVGAFSRAHRASGATLFANALRSVGGLVKRCSTASWN
jgi:hypothetical protein